MKLTRTLTLLVSVPLAVAAGFAGIAAESSLSNADDAADVRDMVRLAGAAGELAYELQTERSAATFVLLPGASTDAPALLARQIQATDAEIARYRDRRGDLDSVPDEAKGVLNAIDSGLATLGDLRGRVNGRGTSLSAASFQYRILISGLLDYRTGVAQFSGAPAGIADDLRTAADLSLAAEASAQQEVAVLRALGPVGNTAAAQQEISEARARYNEALRSFEATAAPDWLSLLEHALVGEQLSLAQRLEDRVARTPAGTALKIERNEWAGAQVARVDRLREVGADIDRQVLADVNDVRERAVWWAVGEITAILVAIVAAALFVWRLSRRLIRRLRSLREAAHQVAYEKLPFAVEALRDPDALGTATPDEFAAQAGDSVPVAGSDEIAEVGGAFRVVFTEAVRLAGNLAGERAGVGAILVNLARRGQVQTSDLLREVDRAEQLEADPERLERLYAIDHHVNLMRRTHDNLLVLGGEGSARVRDNTPLVDVVRVAAQRIKHYTRVQLLSGNVGVTVVGRATEPLAHLLAELLDNATTFSPPTAAVAVDVGMHEDHAVVHITDQGFGLRPDRLAVLNARLAESSRVDLDAVRLMGLTVVSTLAARLGVRVSLQPAEESGTVAVIVIPPHLLLSVRRPGRHRAAAPAVGVPVRAMGSPPPEVPRRDGAESGFPAAPGTTPDGSPGLPGRTPGFGPRPGSGVPDSGVPGIGVPDSGPGVPPGADPGPSGPGPAARPGLVPGVGPGAPLPAITPGAPPSRFPAAARGPVRPPEATPADPVRTPAFEPPAHMPGHPYADCEPPALPVRAVSRGGAAAPDSGAPAAADTAPSGGADNGLPRRVPRATLSPGIQVPANPRTAGRTPERPRDAARVADAMAAFASGTRAGRRPANDPGTPHGGPTAAPADTGEQPAIPRPTTSDPQGREPR